MFKSNSAREIFYIFLWLGVIIALYTLVHRYILEPEAYETHSAATADQQYPTASSTIHTASSANIPVEKKQTHVKATELAQTQKKVTTEKHAPENNLLGLTVEKVIKTVPDQTLAYQGRVKTTEKTKVQATKQEIVAPKTLTKSTVLTLEAKKREHIRTKMLQNIAVPSIPSTPSIPTVPSVPGVQHLIVQPQVQTNDTVHTLQTESEALKKELTRDEKMELIESARQLVIENAEASRTEAIKAHQ